MPMPGPTEVLVRDAATRNSDWRATAPDRLSVRVRLTPSIGAIAPNRSPPSRLGVAARRRGAAQSFTVFHHHRRRVVSR